MFDTTQPSSATSAIAGAILINEFSPNPNGADPATTTVEIKGTPGATFSGFVYTIEADFALPQTVDRKAAVSGTFDTNGLLSVTVPDFENPSFTIVLTDDTATANVGDSYDGTNAAIFGNVLDAIGIPDAAADEVFLAGAALGGTDFAFTGDEPRLVFRDGTTGELYAVNDPDNGAVFDIGGNAVDAAEFDTDPTSGSGTFGSVNPSFTGGGTGGGGGGLTAIYDIQGAAHTSPLNGQAVVTSGVVTAVDTNGFYIQDATGDGDIATSDAIFVFTGSAPGVAVGDAVEVGGVVSEFFPGGAATGNLSTTQISGGPTVDVLSSGNALPTATLIGQGGRIVPNVTIDDDSFASFDPTTDGIDFFESLEAMLVTAQNLVAVAGTSRFGEIFAVTDLGADATGLSARGTLNIAPDDFNPEKIQIDEDSGILPGFVLPTVNVGDVLGDVTGVINYDFGNFQIHPTQAFTPTAGGLAPEVSALAGDTDTLTVASYNVLNLDPNEADGDTDIADGRFAAVAAQVVANLNAPDIIALQEIQDDTGSTDDGTVSAALTLQTLVDAIAAAGGPSYSFIDNTFIADNASGGQPGANIRTAFLYNDARVDLVPGSVATIGGQGTGEAFEGARLPLAADFSFNGETVTVVNNHFSSKGGSAPIMGVEQPFEARQEDVTVNGSLDERQAQSAAVQSFLAAKLAADPAAKLVTLGDLNEFEFVSPVLGIEAALDADASGGNNLTNTLAPDERYSFNFQGNSQSLDHILVSDALEAVAQFDAVHLNSEFAETPSLASDHDPLLASFSIPATPVAQIWTLELLHITDQEASTGQIGDFARASGILNALEAQDLGNDGVVDNTVRLSSGDAIIPGVFYSAAAAVFGSRGIADIQLVNEMGFDAVALGNHEFDNGTAVLAGLIDGSAPGDFSALSGTALDGLDFTGTAFPYLSTNLDFATDPNLAPLAVPGGQAPQPNSVTSSVVLDVNGEKLGVVGAVTPNLASISSTGGLAISPAWASGTPTPAELDALAAEIQAEVDALLANTAGLNKVVLLAHMQQINIEFELAARLSGVDIIVAGGSNTRLFDADDYIRPGDSNQGQYPQFITDVDGNTTAVVNTDGSYKYVGRLVIDFDAQGNIVPGSYDETVSGAYATDAQGLANVAGAAALIDPEVQAITDAIEAEIIATEGNVFGISNVFLNGNRSGTPGGPDGVRTQETNLGNLTADANLAAAQAFDGSVTVSIKNGGGIRASIGETVVPPGGTGFVRQPNGEILDDQGNVVKPAGGISQNDIATTLAFNNELTLLTLTHQELVAVLEHSVGDVGGGRFPQIAGVQFSFDATQPAGSRIVNAAITDAAGNDLAVLVLDGVVQNPTDTVRIVTLNFLAGRGDGYPFPTGASANRADLTDLDGDGVDDALFTGVGTFAEDGSEQDALAEYLAANFGDAANAFDSADTTRDADMRIQNLSFTQDTVIDASALTLVGTRADDTLTGGSLSDTIVLRFGQDSATGNGGADTFIFDGRYVDTGDIHTITDLDFAEGDTVTFRFFDMPRQVASDADLQILIDTGFATVNATTGTEKSVTFQNLDTNFGSPDETFIGTRADDTFDGMAGDDTFVLRFGNDTATGGDDADTFIFDGRYVGNGDAHAITDLNFAEGDVLALRFWSAGVRNVEIGSQADLDAIDAQSWAALGTTATGQLLTLTNDGGDSLTVSFA